MSVAAFGTVSFSVVAGYVAGVSDSGPKPARPGSHQARAQQSDNDHAGVPRFAERLISNPEPASTAEREHRDLAAQENTAAWAFWMVLIAASQAVLSGLGIYFIVQSLKQGRMSIRTGFAGLRQAARQARASESALEHQREIAELDLRPYVYFKEGTVSQPLSSASKVRITIRNFGKTPAFDVRLSFDWKFKDFPIGDFKVPGLLDDADGLPILPPGDESSSHWDLTGLTGGELERIRDGKGAVVLRLLLAYCLKENGPQEVHDVHVAITDVPDLRMLNQYLRERV